MKRIITLLSILLFAWTLSAQVKLVQVERSSAKWHIPVAKRVIPGAPGFAMTYMELQHLMDSLGLAAAADSIYLSNDTIFLRDGSGFVVIPEQTNPDSIYLSNDTIYLRDGSGFVKLPGGGGGTVNSVGLATGTGGTDINVTGSPITTSGTFTLNIPNSGPTSRGALTSADWNLFNNKPGGSGADGRITFWNGSNSLSSSPNLVWNNTLSRFGIGTTPEHTLDINGAITLRFANSLVPSASSFFHLGSISNTSSGSAGSVIGPQTGYIAANNRPIRTLLIQGASDGSGEGISFVTGGTPAERMNIATNGNVRINNLSGTGNRVISANDIGVLFRTDIDHTTILKGNGVANRIPYYSDPTTFTNHQSFKLDASRNLIVGDEINAITTAVQKVDINGAMSFRFANSLVPSSSSFLTLGPVSNVATTSDGSVIGSQTAYIAANNRATRTLLIQGASNGGGEGISFVTGGTPAERMNIGLTGGVTINNLSGSGTRMVTASSTGLLQTQAMPDLSETNELITAVTSMGLSAGGNTISITEAGTTRVGVIPPMTGATAGAAGIQGVVPAPAAGNQNKFLRGDGTWQDAGSSLSGTTGYIPYFNSSTTLAPSAVSFRSDAIFGIGFGLAPASITSDIHLGTGKQLEFDGTATIIDKNNSGGSADEILTRAATGGGLDWRPLGLINGQNILSGDITIPSGITGTGSAGRVAFWTGVSSQSNSNNLFWDNSASRLGIGTLTPSRALDNTGASRFRGAIYDSGDSPGTTGQVMTSNGASAWTWNTPPTNSVIVATNILNFTTTVTGQRTLELSQTDINTGGFTFDNANDYITINATGVYEVTFSGNMGNDVAASNIWFQRWNGTTWDFLYGNVEGRIPMIVSAGFDYPTVYITSIANLNNGDRIRVVRNHSSGHTLHHMTSHLKIKRIS